MWLETYPALRNISWAPSTTINNTADGNVAIGALAHGVVADHANATAAQFKVPRDTTKGACLLRCAASVEDGQAREAHGTNVAPLH